MRASIGRATLAAIIVIVVALVAVVGIYYYYVSTHGTVSVYLEDPGGNSPAAIYVTITSIMLHSTSGSWITISNSTITVQLSSVPSLLASATIPTGNYTEVRLVISSATVTIGGVNVTAKLPSSMFKIPIIAGGMKVSGGSKVYLVISMGPQLTVTGSGQPILRPVMTAEAYYSPPSNTTS